MGINEGTGGFMHSKRINEHSFREDDHQKGKRSFFAAFKKVTPVKDIFIKDEPYRPPTSCDPFQSARTSFY